MNPAGWSLLTLTMLTACASPGSNNGTWIGDVTPRTPGPACAKTRGLAQIQGDRLSFTPSEGTWMLIGTAEANGRLTAERITQGANKMPYETRLEGSWSSTRLTGTYTTPRCVSDVDLIRR